MPKYRPLPTLERLNELLEVVEIPEDKYGEWSGLVWKVSRGGQWAKSVAGCLVTHKQIPGRVDWKITIDGVIYFISRVIYCMTHSESLGNTQVDHKDQNPLNNNTWNLRLDVDGVIQNANRPMQRNNTSGITGLSVHKATGKWRAYVKVQGKTKHLGLYVCKIEAARAVNEKWRELGWLELGRKPNDLKTIACDCEKCYPAGKTK